MSKTDKPTEYLDTPKQRLLDFMFVYYPDDVAKRMSKSPEAAFSIILEDIGYGISPIGRLSAYVQALHDAVSLMGDTARVKANSALTGYKASSLPEIRNG